MFDNRWDNWVGDFTESFATREFASATRDQVATILHHFGTSAKQIDPDFPEQMAPQTVQLVFANHLPQLALAPAIRADIPEVVARFFEFLEDGGRLGGGYEWAEQTRRLVVGSTPAGPPKLAVKGTPIRNTPKTAVGRNDPCPCGSGKKYKKCCFQ